MRPKRSDNKYWTGTRNFNHFQYESDLEDYISDLEVENEQLHKLGVVRPEVESAQEGELLGNEAGATKPVREVCIKGGERLENGECAKCNLLWGKCCAELL